jgi:predicted NUDIX family phosphoesterase
MKFIFVVKRRDLEGLIPPIGLIFPPQESCAERFARGFFIERPHAERDPDFKQVIPYTVLRRGPEVFVFRRLTGGGEARLHDLRSIGVGGHIEPSERVEAGGSGAAGAGGSGAAGAGDPGAAGAWEMIRAAALREIHEEVCVDSPSPLQLRYAGLLNDESNEVGTVHTGVVFLAELPPEATVTVRETDVLAGRFEPLAALRADPASPFETWSRHILDAPGGPLCTPEP